MELVMDRPLFKFMLRRAARKGRRRKIITKEERQMIVDHIRRPIVETEDGPIDALRGMQSMVEAKAMRKAAEAGVPVTFDWLTIIAIIVEMLPQLLEWIRELLDKLNPAEEGE